MKIRLLKAYQFHAAGAIIDTFADPICTLLIQRGVAEPIELDASSKSMDGPPRNKAMRKPHAQKSGGEA